MSSLILKVTIASLALICVALSLAIRLDYNYLRKWVFDKDIIYDTDIYGDLYQICLVEDFRIQIEPRKRQFQYSEKQAAISDADIFVLGDSFLDHPRQTGIPELISDSLGLKVFYESHYLSPLYMIGFLNIEKSKRRVLILQVVERYLSTIDTLLLQKNLNDPIMSTHDSSLTIESKVNKLLVEVVNFFFPIKQETDYEYFLKRVKYFSRITSLISTIRFRLLGYINEKTPVYSRNPPFLFYHETVDSSKFSYFHFHSDEEIEKVARTITNIRDYIENNYNLELVLLPVPNKISIYHGLVTNVPYDDYLPRLYRELKKQEVQVIEIYQDFKNATDLVYYPSDTHWNTSGMNIAYEKTVEKLTELSWQTSVE